MPSVSIKSVVSREVIAARFAQKCRDLFKSGVPYYPMFELSIMTPEVIDPLLAYSDDDFRVRANIRTLVNHSWVPDSIEDVLYDLNIFNNDDIRLIIWGFRTMTVDDSFDKIFNKYSQVESPVATRNELTTREVIVMRFIENFLASLGSGVGLYSTFAIAITGPEVAALLAEYGQSDSTIQKGIDTLVNHSWNPYHDLEELLQGLSVFSDYDVHLIVTGYISANLDCALKTILEQYRYCYNI